MKHMKKMKKNRFLLASVGAAVLQLSFAANAQDEVVTENPDTPVAVTVDSAVTDSAVKTETQKGTLGSAVEEDQRNALERDIARREYQERAADDQYLVGQTAFMRGDYKTAVASYQRAIEEIKKCYIGENPPAPIARKIENFRSAISDAYFSWANALIRDADDIIASGSPEKADEAMNLLQEATKIWPASAAKVNPKLAEVEKLRKVTVHNGAVSPATANPEGELNMYRISVLMRQGKAFFLDNKLERAKESFEDILRIDPYNREATEMMRQVNSAFDRAAERRNRAMRGERMSETNFHMVSPLPPKAASGESFNADDGIVAVKKESPIEKKLKEIIIDHIAFEDVPLSTALRYLTARSKDLDPDKKGINFMCKVEVPSAAPADGAEGEGTVAATTSPEDFYRVNMVIDQVPLSQVIDGICKAASHSNIEIKKNVEEFAVVIYSSNVAISVLETRIWPLETPPAEMPANDAPGLIDYFRNHGVAFPDGTTAIYDDAISRLIVTNTLDQINLIEDIIEDFRGTEPQVLIETRFVEVAQNDLEEIGFDWMVTRLPPPGASAKSIPFRFGTSSDLIPASTGADEWVADATSPTGYRLVEVTQPTPNALRSIGRNGLGNNVIVPGTVQDKAFWWRHTADRRVGSATNPNVPNEWGQDASRGVDIDVGVRALSQLSSADVLATPRVTTMNGEPAMIRMVTEVYYPTEWTEPETFSMNNDNFNFNGNANNNNGQVPMGVIGSTPVFADPVEIGIRLDVTPHIDPGHEIITLEMKPQILTFAGWNEYSYELDVNSDGMIDAAEKQILKMPIIETRTVETSVRVADGETLVLGGALRDKTYTLRDKIPFLGDIPIVGRLFRTDGSLGKKTNLLIFLNCRLVHPDGEPILGMRQRGLAPFRH